MVERIEGPSHEIEELAGQDQARVRLMSVPIIGPIISLIIDCHEKLTLSIIMRN
jgi:hypothetical protein